MSIPLNDVPSTRTVAQVVAQVPRSSRVERPCLMPRCARFPRRWLRRAQRRRLHFVGSGTETWRSYTSRARSIAAASRAPSRALGLRRGDLRRARHRRRRAVPDDALRRVDRRAHSRVALSAGDDQRSCRDISTPPPASCDPAARAPSSRRRACTRTSTRCERSAPTSSSSSPREALDAPAGSESRRRRCRPTTSRSCSSRRDRRRRPRASSSRIAISRRTSTPSAGPRASRTSPDDVARQLAAAVSRHGAGRHGARRALRRVPAC